jgi:dynein heavy chain
MGPEFPAVTAKPPVSLPSYHHVHAQINYGGRVTDDLDRRCLMSILRQYITPRVLDDAYRLTPSGTYYVPQDGPLDSYRDFLRALPLTEAPEVRTLMVM